MDWGRGSVCGPAGPEGPAGAAAGLQAQGAEAVRAVCRGLLQPLPPGVGGGALIFEGRVSGGQAGLGWVWDPLPHA